MADIFWYYAHDDQQMGPVSSVELKRLASVGELSPDDLIWREGMDEWAPAQRVKGLFPPRDGSAPDAEAAAQRGAAATPSKIAHTAMGPPIVIAPAAPSLAGPPPVAMPLAGELSQEPSSTGSGLAPPPAAASPPRGARAFGVENAALTPSLKIALFAAQGILWATCVMVVVLGGVLFMITMLSAKSKPEQAASAQVSAALFIGAYVLARAGERACLLLESFLSSRR